MRLQAARCPQTLRSLLRAGIYTVREPASVVNEHEPV
jgi:hypothetical protein